ncbi:MAG: LysE family translocator [Tagaea sp.]
MDFLPLAVFAAVVAVAIATPGPTLVLVVARVLAKGRRGHGAFAAGLIAGDVVWLAAAVFGMAALAENAHAVFVAIKWAGCAYLVWLAWRLWTAPAAAVDVAEVRPARGLADAAGGFAVAMANPKTMVFYLALVPNLIDARAVDPEGFAVLAAIVVTVYCGVLLAYVRAASGARSLFATPRAMRNVRRGSAVVLAGTAAVVATRA